MSLSRIVAAPGAGSSLSKMSFGVEFSQACHSLAVFRGLALRAKCAVALGITILSWLHNPASTMHSGALDDDLYILRPRPPGCALSTATQCCLASWAGTVQPGTRIFERTTIATSRRRLLRDLPAHRIHPLTLRGGAEVEEDHTRACDAASKVQALVRKAEARRQNSVKQDEEWTPDLSLFPPNVSI